MINTNRPRRSVLYMPGANTRALEKAKSLAADSLIFDLEDAGASLVCKDPISLNAKIYMGLMGKTADYRKLFHARIMKQPAKPYSIWWVGRDSNPRPTD